MGIVTQASMAEFFTERVQAALREQSIELDEASQVYLVNLLEDFTHTGNLQVGEGEGESGTPALFRLYQRAMNATAQEAAFAYRHMGDVALVVAGMFSPHVERSLVNVDYYVKMGGSAYHRASFLDRSGMLAPALSQLARCFDKVVEVLTRIAERTTLPVPAGVADLYARWARNPDCELTQRLMLGGAIPILGAGGRA